MRDLNKDPQDSPEEKRQKKIDEEVLEKEKLMDETTDVEYLRKVAKAEIRSQVRRRLLEEEEKSKFKSSYEISEKEKETANERIRNLENRENLKEWPNKIRNIVFNIEEEFSFGSWYVCKRCAQIHKGPDCEDNRKIYPPSPKERRIFERRQKWLWFILENNAICARMVKSKLEIEYNKIILKKPELYSETEKFIASLPNSKHLIYYFCDSIARVFEYFTFELKQEHGIQQEIENLGIFRPPFDKFMAWFVNSFVIMKADGEVTFSLPIQPISLNPDVDAFLEPVTANANVDEFLPK